MFLNIRSTLGDMAKLSFEDLSFDEEGERIKVNFLRIFFFYLPKKDLEKIDDFTIEKNAISFKNISQEKAEKKFYMLLEKGFKDLKNGLNNKPAVYAHKNSGIPLIGNVAFGLIDRDTNVIEVKPITGCNLKCVYCSVDEDKRPVDFVVEEDYLAEEFRKLVEFKKVENIEAHIASQGEPLLYAALTELIKDLAKIKEVKVISIDTNGIMLTKNKVDELIDAGLTRFNFSINALDEKIAKEVAGCAYDIGKIKEICKYISGKANLIITPVLIPGVNDDEMPKIIEFAKELKADIGIQNFLNYKFGRNPVKHMGFEDFYDRLRGWEKKFGVKLIKSVEDFDIVKAKPLPKPFRKNEVVEADIVCIGRLPYEKIAVAKETSEGRFRKDKVFSKRSISLPNCDKKGKVRVKITRTKHNIFIGSVC